MGQLKQTLIIISLSLILVACQTGSKDGACAPLTRAAYDIGSGTTKLKVAKVNPCLGEVLEVLAEEQIKVDYRESLDATERFPQETMDAGLTSLKKLTEIAKNKGAEESRAVATEAFREAANADELVTMIKAETGLDVEVISQEKEALLGYLAALNEVPFAAAEVVVWDIGGGSQQIVFSDGKEDPEIYTNEVGSVVFKNQVLRKIKGLSPTRHSSPNPLSKTEIQAAEKLAKQLQKNYPTALLKALQKPGMRVLGIGGVHAYSISAQTDTEETYTSADLQEALQERTGWSDEKLGGEYSATDITNLILVRSAMGELKINEVRPLQIHLTDALLIQ